MKKYIIHHPELIIEDERDNRELLAYNLKKRVYHPESNEITLRFPKLFNQ